MGIWDSFSRDDYNTLLKNLFLYKIPQNFDPTSLQFWNDYMQGINDAKSSIIGNSYKPEDLATSNYLDYNWNNLSNPTYSDFKSLDPSVQSQVWSNLTSKQQIKLSNLLLKDENKLLKELGKDKINGTLIPSLFETNDKKKNDLGFSSLSEAKQNKAKVAADLEHTSQDVANANATLKAARMNVAGQTMGVAGDILNNVLPSRPEYEGDRGLITAGMDQAYDSIADAIGMVPGWGTLVSGIMKARAGVNKLMGLIGGGTDGMTNTDAILGSSFLGLTPFGLINGFGGKRADTFTKDNQAFAQVGGSYTGSNARADEALEKSGKKYGLFSAHQRRRANEQIAEAKRQLNIISGISDESQRRNTLRGSMSGINSTHRAVNRNGGYNQSHTRVGKLGLKIIPYKARRLVSNVTFYQKGGPITKDRTLEELIEYAKELNPRFIQRLMEKPTQWVETPSGRPGTHLLSYSNINSGWYVWPLIQELNGQLTYIPNPEDAMDKAMQDGDYLRFNSEEEAKNFSENYKKGFPKFLEEFEKLISNKVEKDEQGTKITYLEPVDFDVVVTTFKDGGSILEPVDFDTISKPTENETQIDPLELELIPLFLKGGPINDNILEYFGNPDLSNIKLKKSKKPRTEGNTIYYSNDEDLIHELTHYLTQNQPNEIYKEFYNNLDDNKIRELGGDLDFILEDPNLYYQPSELEARINAAKFMSKGLNYTQEFFNTLRQNENQYGYNMRDLLHMYNDENLEKIFNVDNILEFLNGGEINVIPDGALHKNLHHMEDAEHLTKKGIPVVAIDNGELVAEIEKSEIILRKSVTEKLEELCELYYSEDATKELKDDYALEAGELLVDEILNNTIDNTNKLL